MAHIERRDGTVRSKSRILVQTPGFDVVVVNAEPSVGISDGHVEGKIVIKGVVVVVELGEGGIGDVEFDFVGADDEPEYEDGDSEDD